MKLDEFRKLTRDLPDNTELCLYNNAYEWYGLDKIESEAFYIDRDKNELILSFGGKWNEHDKKDYALFRKRKE